MGLSPSPQTEREKQVLTLIQKEKRPFADFFREKVPAKNPEKLAADLLALHLACKEMNKELLAYLSKHRPHFILFGYTDTMPEQFESNRSLGFYQLFQEIFTSFQFGCKKCDSEAFDILQQKILKYSLSPSDCLFVDDREENILNAKAKGFSIVHYTQFPSIKQIVEAVDKLSSLKSNHKV